MCILFVSYEWDWGCCLLLGQGGGWVLVIMGGAARPADSDPLRLPVGGLTFQCSREPYLRVFLASHSSDGSRLGPEVAP